MKLSDLKINPNNPQKFDDLSKLENSIKEFPKMMKLRPLVYDSLTKHVLGGNKRLICLQNLGYKEIPNEWVKSADELTKEEKQRFIIADNVGFGEWDMDILHTEWNVQELEEWGLETDFLEEPSFDDLTDEMKNNSATLKITFESPEQLQKAEIDIQELIDRKYIGAYLSVSAGEL